MKLCDRDSVLAYVGDLNGISRAKGRALFFEGRCSTCHQVDSNGLAITDPAIIVKDSSSEAILYDLTSPPPVGRP